MNVTVPSRVCLVGTDQPRRHELERFVRDCYREHYRATPAVFLPYLLGLLDERDELHGVLGFRPGSQPLPFFLEAYLDAPIEERLSKAVGRPVERRLLAEVGNLAASSAGGSRCLITALTAYLDAADYEWAVFTATITLRNSFARLKVPMTDLGPADPGRLGASAEAWGDYYATSPRVTAVPVHGVKHCLLRASGLVRRFALLWADAACTGVGQPCPAGVPA